MADMPRGFSGDFEETLTKLDVLNVRFRLALMYFTGEESLARNGDVTDVDYNIATALFYELCDDYSKLFSSFQSLFGSLDSVKVVGEVSS